jgi:hypothetical protein
VTAPGYFNDTNYGAQAINDILQQTQPSWSVDYWFIRDACSPSVFTRPPAP